MKIEFNGGEFFTADIYTEFDALSNTVKMFLYLQVGYFGDTLDQLIKEIENDNTSSVRCVESVNNTIANGHLYYATDGNHYRYFLPMKKVMFIRKTKKKKSRFRPYQTVSEVPFKVGDVVHVREKGGETEKEFCTLVMGMYSEKGHLKEIYLGGDPIEVDFLLKNCEWLNDKHEWKPCGMKVENED